jgi:hypothetical protein
MQTRVNKELSIPLPDSQGCHALWPFFHFENAENADDLVGGLDTITEFGDKHPNEEHIAPTADSPHHPTGPTPHHAFLYKATSLFKVIRAILPAQISGSLFSVSVPERPPEIQVVFRSEKSPCPGQAKEYVEVNVHL